ncbi:MAG: NAD(P)/FAD-dependent oxidoreductase [Acidimicrobiales bacterium]
MGPAPTPVAPITVTVVGAGLAGLVAARHLAEAGHGVVVLEHEGRAGGRLATVEVAGARADAGAQFFTVRSPDLAHRLGAWRRDGLVYEWCRGFGHPPDGHPRYAARGGFGALARHLAQGLDVRLGVAAVSVRATPTGWEVVSDGGRLGSGPVLLACPVPTSLALLRAGGVPLEAAVGAELGAIGYTPTLAVVAVADRPTAVPPPGGVQLRHGPFSFVADNAQKGISARPALTLHATPEVSAARWGQPDRTVLADLTAAARPWLGPARVVEARLVRWSHATPHPTYPQPACVVATAPEVLVLAGDAFAGPRVEGAFLSGLAAAHAVSSSSRPGGRR